MKTDQSETLRDEPAILDFAPDITGSDHVAQTLGSMRITMVVDPRAVDKHGITLPSDGERAAFALKIEKALPAGDFAATIEHSTAGHFDGRGFFGSGATDG